MIAMVRRGGSRGLPLVYLAGYLLFFASPASAQELWSHPATWGGQVPGAGAHVVIPQGRRIVLDVSPPPLGSITVNGALTFDDRDIDLTVGWVMVHGLFEVGTEEEPYAHRAMITLNGPLDDDIMGMGARFLGAMHGGALQIHGSRRDDVDWAVLAAQAQPGDTTITLALVEPNKPVLGWRPGDRLAIAPSGRDPLQAEAVTVTSVSGNQVSFTPPLGHHHWGALQTIGGRVVDQRAEVGLLTRNIVIRGAPDGYARQMGGHIMIMAGSIGRLEGVELHHMGQQGRKGRYPIHWHLTGYAPIDYARFTSIWSSFHRAIAIHQTHGVEVRGNVAADIWSHTYVVGEDGNEIGNIVEDNLGILTKRLPEHAFAFARAGDPGAAGPAAQDEWRPATFWINSPDNRVRRNRAAGGLDAVGFYVDDDHGRFVPQSLFAGDFVGNVAHSYSTSALADPDPDTATGVGLMVRASHRIGPRRYDAFTAYHNTVAGAWLEHATDLLQDAILADNASGVVLARGRVDGALIVGRTANAITVHPQESTRGGVRLVRRGDGKAPQVRNTTFVRLTPAAVDVDSAHVLPGNLFENVTLVDTAVPVFLRDRARDHAWSGGLLDVDGSLTGTGHATLVSGHPLDGTSVFRAGWGTFAPGGAFTTQRTMADGPTGFTAYADNRTVHLAWYSPQDSSVVDTYVLEAGSSPGRADLLLMPVGAMTSLTIPDAPAGQFFLRVRGRGPGGLSPSSNEVRVVVGGSTCAIAEPPVLTYTLNQRTVTLTWTHSLDAASHVIGVGSRPGRYDVLVTHMGAGAMSFTAEAPPGTYYVRLAGWNDCGLGTPSNEVAIVVP